MNIKTKLALQEVLKTDVDLQDVGQRQIFFKLTDILVSRLENMPYEVKSNSPFSGNFTENSLIESLFKEPKNSKQYMHLYCYEESAAQIMGYQLGFDAVETTALEICATALFNGENEISSILSYADDFFDEYTEEEEEEEEVSVRDILSDVAEDIVIKKTYECSYAKIIIDYLSESLELSRDYIKEHFEEFFSICFITFHNEQHIDIIPLPKGYDERLEYLLTYIISGLFAADSSLDFMLVDTNDEKTISLAYGEGDGEYNLLNFALNLLSD